MNVPSSRRARLRAWYEEVFLPLYGRMAPAVLATCVIFSLFAMVSTYLQQRTQDRITDTLLECFDTYANRTYEVSSEVRKASQHVDQIEARADAAAARRDAAFQDLIDAALAKPPPTEQESLEAVLDLQAANGPLADARAKLVAAREVLQQTRIDHPVPDPPSQFCELPE